MPDGDPVQATEQQTVETVLSQQTESNQPEAQSEHPNHGKTPEQRFKNAQWADARIRSKQLKEVSSKELVEEALKQSGVDPNKDENKPMIQTLTNLKELESKANKERNSQLSNINLSESFERIGIKADSNKAYILGSHLRRKYGISNPEIFNNEDLIRREEEILSEDFGGTRKDPVSEAILRKASSVVPQKVDPKGAKPPSEDKQLAEEALRLGVSKEKMKSIKDKQTKLPKWA